MPPIRAELEKRAGLYYAVTDEGVELPILDLGHPAFSHPLTEAELAKGIAHHEVEQRTLQRIPRPLRRWLLRFALRGSVLGQGLLRSEGSFLAGMSTYLLKLGPDLLGRAYAAPIDRRIAGSVQGRCIRQRLGDMARLLADALLPQLAACPGRSLDVINIAGGPAMDSINALLLLQREAAGVLAGRTVTVRVLDQDLSGPHFGQRALAALQAPSAPLAGLSIALLHEPYDWQQPSGLANTLEQVRSRNSVCVASSEGGLFEYGSEQDIVRNLTAFHQHAPADFAIVGSVTRGDALARRMVGDSGALLHPRGLAVFARLIEGTGLHISRSIERTLSDQVVLTRAPG
ncbi:MAG: hypothetical protein RL685_3105 [Pseudomonadota bacterium]|jgi:hypothetical protein